MFIELRLPLDAFVVNLRSRLKQLAIPLTDALPTQGSGVGFPGCGGGPVWLDRIKVWDGTDVSALNASTLQIRQPIDIFIVSQSALQTNGANASPACWQRSIEAVFELSCGMGEDGAELCLRFTEFRPGADVPPPMMAFLHGVVGQAAALAPLCQGLDIAVLDAMFAGEPPPVMAVALAIAGERVALRLDFDLDAFSLSTAERLPLQALQTQQRSQFAAGQFLQDDASLPWTMLVHALLPRQAARQQLLASLALQASSFRLDSGPSTAFKVGSDGVGRVELDFSGEAIDACICAWGELDLNIDARTALKFSLPQTNRIQARMEFGFDLNDAEVLCCALTTGMLWLAVGQTWVKQDEITGGEFAGITTLQVALGPMAVALPFMAMVHGRAEGEFQPGTDWTQVSEPGDDLLVYERDWNAGLGDVGFGEMAMTGLRGIHNSQTRGLLMSGTLSPARERSDPRLIVQADADFVVYFDDSCGDDPKLQARWHLRLTHPPGQGNQIASELQLYDVRLVAGSDLLNQYAPHLGRTGGHLWVVVPFSAILPAYAAAPYAPQILVASNGGVRILTLPRLPLWSAQQIDEAMQANAAWRVVRCEDWTLSHEFWKGGRFNPLWHVDPSPDERLWQLWEVGVRGMTPGEALRIEVLAGAGLPDQAARHVATSRASEAGGALWRGVLAPGAGLSMFKLRPGQTGMPAQARSAKPVAPLRLHASTLKQQLAQLKAEARGKLLLRPKRHPRRGIEMRQTPLWPLASLRLAQPLRGLLAALHGQQPALVVADGGGATLWSLATPEAPRPVQHLRLRGLQRAFNWQGQAWLLAGGSLLALHDRAAQHCGSGEAIVDADADGTQLFMLSGRALWHCDHPGAPARYLQEARAEHLAVHHESLALADDTGVRILPRRGARLGAALATIALPGLRSLQAVAGIGDSYQAIDASGQTWTLSITGQRAFIQAQRDAISPPQCLARSGRLLALANVGAHTVRLLGMGPSSALQRA